MHLEGIYQYLRLSVVDSVQEKIVLLSATWLPISQLLAIIKEAALLSPC